MCRSVSNEIVTFEKMSCIFRISNPVLLTMNEMKVKNANRMLTGLLLTKTTKLIMRGLIREIRWILFNRKWVAS